MRLWPGAPGPWEPARFRETLGTSGRAGDARAAEQLLPGVPCVRR